jgi:hypothetical protein
MLPANYFREKFKSGALPVSGILLTSCRESRDGSWVGLDSKQAQGFFSWQHPTLDLRFIQAPIQWIPEGLSPGGKQLPWRVAVMYYRGYESLELYIHSPIRLHGLLLNYVWEQQKLFDSHPGWRWRSAVKETEGLVRLTWKSNVSTYKNSAKRICNWTTHTQTYTTPYLI